MIATRKKRILFLGETVAGSLHDYTQLKQEFPGTASRDALVKWFEPFVVWVDLGYLGFQKMYAAQEVKMPHKKPRKSKKNPSPVLTDEQKAENRALSRVRVLVEQAISGLKRCNIVIHRFRNRVGDFADTAALLAAGLWNWKLTCQGITN